ncbi:Uncharacterized protein conserved in bacteria [Sebaldella termitidis]|uniref:DUF2059 domain-containing protein n=1 Tax=Sebaldella termitidis (strain ATCC 33386 / NCTC 11300) TaxID=526218 RepID=D1AQF8_SEBTE|nr:DUF2059 domain-containing protein [Sebaldella termitidis]ACZ10218.1 hypothetical protein Sterm_3379 [Sebaldella termitidis ATCC 33386]MBP7978847.1 DUF2059 domain-containing protein [Sebaldella sp.]SUI25557.1 Uncharacterized protein conserved in bacteria [Sebaldella termitidis]
MKKLFIITMLVFTINITVFSAETPKQKKIKELFQVMDIQAATNEMSEMILNDTDSMKLSKNQKAAMQKEMQSMMDYVLNKQAELYDRHFTEQEIDDILNFYKTPAGKKIIEETPKITKELFTDLMENYYPDMIKRMEKIK